MADSLTEPAKLLLLAALLTNDKIISNNGKAFLKELILRRDTRIAVLLKKFEVQNSGDSSFLESLHELIMNEAQTLYNELFFDTSLEVGKTLSKTERDNKNLAQEKSLIYGEVEFSSFYRVLRKINPAPGRVFYDLGSGTGKALFAARFVYDFSKCVGIEILSGLHHQAEVVLNRYNAQFKSLLALGQSQTAMVYEGSFLDFDWSDGEVVFANSTCFDDSLMLSLSHMAERLAPGAIVVTFTKGMTTPAFELLERKRYRMSWGPATVFIHRRLNLDGTPVGPASLNVLPSDDITYDEDLRNQSIDSLTDHHHDHNHTAHDYSSKDSEEEDEESDDGEEDDDEDRDYDDDIDMYIKQGFDMDPDNEDDEQDEEEEDEDDEEEDEEDSQDDGDDEEESDDEEEEEEEEEEEDQGSGSEDADTEPATHSRDVNNNNANLGTSAGYDRPASAPSSQQQQAQHNTHAHGHGSHHQQGSSPTDDRLNSIMEKIADRRKIINELTGSSPSRTGAYMASPSPSAGSTTTTSASPSRVPRTNTAATPPSTGNQQQGRSQGIAHSPVTSSFTPPRSPATATTASNNTTAAAARTPPTQQQLRQSQHSAASGSNGHNGHENHHGHTITVEAPLSASRGNLMMLNPNLMRSPNQQQAQAHIPLNLSTGSLNSAAGSSSPGVQIHSPLDSALLNRKRAAAVGKRVPLSAYPSPFREDF